VRHITPCEGTRQRDPAGLLLGAVAGFSEAPRAQANRLDIRLDALIEKRALHDIELLAARSKRQRFKIAISCVS